MEGFIKLHRKLLENPVVCKDGETMAIWMYLLLNATYKPYDVMFKGKRQTLQPGQLLTGRNSIARKLAISSSKVERTLKMFEIEQQIEQQTSSQNRLVTILNWNKYQVSEQRIGQRVDNE